jgi:hypothetical protein
MCAAIAPVTNQVAANTKANIGMAARGGAVGLPPGSGAGSGGGARGMRSRLSGRQTSRLSAAQMRQAPRQPMRASRKAESGQPIVLANPAINVIPVIGARAARP